MARDLSAYLCDIFEACNAIEDVMKGVTLEDYRRKRAIRSSVEREFIIIGEALRKISALDNRLFMSISNSRSVVDFRNLLTHNYGAINDNAVYPHYQERCHPSQSQTRGLDGAEQCVVTARRSRLMSEGG
jgi:uncharacterized protein with HEPN domain